MGWSLQAEDYEQTVVKNWQTAHLVISRVSQEIPSQYDQHLILIDIVCSYDLHSVLHPSFVSFFNFLLLSG